MREIGQKVAPRPICTKKIKKGSKGFLHNRQHAAALWQAAHRGLSRSHDRDQKGLEMYHRNTHTETLTGQKLDRPAQSFTRQPREGMLVPRTLTETSTASSMNSPCTNSIGAFGRRSPAYFLAYVYHVYARTRMSQGREKRSDRDSREWWQERQRQKAKS